MERDGKGEDILRKYDMVVFQLGGLLVRLVGWVAHGVGFSSATE
jgi:hypothetical protein